MRKSTRRKVGLLAACVFFSPFLRQFEMHDLRQFPNGERDG